MTQRLGIVLVAFAAVPLLAQTTGTARFQYERNIEVEAAGPQRLDVDVRLLSGSQPFTVSAAGERWMASGGLNDLRLFGADGREVPYLLMPPAVDAPEFVDGRVLPITATDTPNEKSSGFEVDLDTVMAIDAIDLSRVQAPFLKRLRLEGSGDRTRWTQLLAEGTAFNLPAEQLAHTRIEFVPGEYRYIRVVWDDTNSGRVAAPDRVSLRRVTRSSSRRILRERLAVSERPSEPGRSRFRVSLPASRLPVVALELNVSGGHLSRAATVLESRLVGDHAEPQVIGSARLVRVMREGIAADALRIPIRQPIEPELDLVVVDGDNPRLLLQSVTAVFAELPWIYFEAPVGTITARYGDARLAAARYDLEAARNNVPESPANAAWQPGLPRTTIAEPEGLPMPQTGSALELEGYEYVRDIGPGQPGLIAIPLDAAVVSRSGTSTRRLADIRIVDRSGFQIPYLLERRDEPLIVNTSAERRELPDAIKTEFEGSTTYIVKLPFQQLPDTRLVLTTRARVFKRTVTLGSIAAAGDRRPERFVRYGSESWIHADDASPAPAVTFSVPESLDRDLMLVIEEGDNQPLPLDQVTLLMPSYALRLFRPADQPLRLVYGRDGIAPPSYDLQLLAPQLMGRRAEPVLPGAEQRFADAPSRAVELVSPLVFWSALSLAVLVLLAMVVKLMQREAVQ